MGIGGRMHTVEQAMEIIDALEPTLRSELYTPLSGFIERLPAHAKLETGGHRAPLSADEKRALLRRLIDVFAFERFIQKAYLGQKMFSIEGLDVVVPMIDALVGQSRAAGAEEVVIGMAHRGRLSVLVHNLGRSPESIMAEFEGAKFRQAGRFGPILAASSVILDNVTFEHDVVIEVASPMLFCLGTRFAEAATLRLRHTSVVLDGAVFAKPSTIAFAPDAFKRLNVFTDEDEEPFDESPAARAISGRSARPSLLSLRGVDLATLTLSELDLSACLFQGAHHLDQLRIEGARPFADTPTGWRFGRVGGQGMPVWHWTRRQTLAEEHHWRANRQLPAAPSGRPHPQRVGWYSPDENLIPRWVVLRTRQDVERLTPDRLAALYRALRNAQEDSKNEPGAADFYYGEMEMRRLDPQTPWAERVIMWLYWLVSGYGLRGLRALAWLVAVVVGLAVLLQVIGFNGGDPGFRDALIYAAQSTIFIATGNKALTEHVSWAGEVLRIPLRLAGPVLLGLALLSARNRVKR